MSEAMLRQVEGMVDAEPAGLLRFECKAKASWSIALIAVGDHVWWFDAALARGLTSYIGRRRRASRPGRAASAP